MNTSYHSTYWNKTLGSGVDSAQGMDQDPFDDSAGGPPTLELTLTFLEESEPREM